MILIEHTENRGRIVFIKYRLWEAEAEKKANFLNNQ